MTEDEQDETLRDIAHTLGVIARAVEGLARRIEALEGELADSCYLEGCGNPAGVHGLCEDHTPRAIQ